MPKIQNSAISCDANASYVHVDAASFCFHASFIKHKYDLFSSAIQLGRTIPIPDRPVWNHGKYISVYGGFHGETTTERDQLLPVVSRHY